MLTHSLFENASVIKLLIYVIKGGFTFHTNDYCFFQADDASRAISNVCKNFWIKK